MPVPTSNASIQVNKTTVPGGPLLATYQYTDVNENVVESEAVTLTRGDGTEVLGPNVSADSIPVVMASDQSPIPVEPISPLTTGLNLPPAVAVTSAVAVEVIGANTARTQVTIQNLGTGNIRVGDATVTTATGIRVTPNGTFVFQNPNVYQGPIFAIAEAADTSAIALEGQT